MIIGSDVMRLFLDKYKTKYFELTQMRLDKYGTAYYTVSTEGDSSFDLEDEIIEEFYVRYNHGGKDKLISNWRIE